MKNKKLKKTQIKVQKKDRKNRRRNLRIKQAKKLRIKLPKLKAFTLQTRAEDARHQITREDKENIHADKATAKTGDAKVIKNNGDNGPGAQTIDVGAEVIRFCGAWLHLVWLNLASVLHRVH